MIISGPAVTHLILPGLSSAAPIRHAFCSRHKGSSTDPYETLNLCTRQGDDPRRVAENKAILSRTFGFALEHLITMEQVHGDRVIIPELPLSSAPQGDALVTGSAGVVLGVFTADCVPVILADMDGRAVGIVHAGWRGVALGIVEKALATMGASFSCDPTRVAAGIGPAIGPCCFEISKDTAERLRASTPEPESFLHPNGRGRWQCDLPGAVRLQLARAGLPPQNVHSENLCTKCRPDLFFSARRDGPVTGRQLSFVLLPDGGTGSPLAP